MPEAVKTQANPLHVGAGLSVDRALQQQTSDIPLITTMIEHERNNADGEALASVVCRKVDLSCSGTRRSRAAQCRRDPVFNISDDCTRSKRRRYLLARNRSCSCARGRNLFRLLSVLHCSSFLVTDSSIPVIHLLYQKFKMHMPDGASHGVQGGI